MAPPWRYRIESPDAAPRATVVVCDGDHRWEVYQDWIYRPPAVPAPRRLNPLLGLAWLLEDYRLVPGGSSAVAGRDGLRIVAEPTAGAEMGSGIIARVHFVYDQIELTVDAELGVLLRGSWRFRGQTLLTAELTEVRTEADPKAFEFTPPPGMPVHTNPLGAIPAVRAARSAVKLAADIGQRIFRPR
jgi:hypothetical protein